MSNFIFLFSFFYDIKCLIFMKQRFKKLRNGFQHKNLRSKKVTNKTKVEVINKF